MIQYLSHVYHPNHLRLNRQSEFQPLLPINDEPIIIGHFVHNNSAVGSFTNPIAPIIYGVFYSVHFEFQL
jgi:hypothetical protein